MREERPVSVAAVGFLALAGLVVADGLLLANWTAQFDASKLAANALALALPGLILVLLVSRSWVAWTRRNLLTRERLPTFVVTTVVLTGGAATSIAWLAAQSFSTIQTPHAAAIAVAAGTVLIIAFWLSMGAWVHELSMRLLASRAARPVFAVAATGALAAGMWASWKFPSYSALLARPDFGAPVFGIVFLALIALVARRNPSFFRPSGTKAGVGVCIAATVLLWASPGGIGTGARALSEDHSLGAMSVRAQTQLLDFDRDGAANLLGQHDCAPFDPTQSPFSLEVPNNGLDEDCSGRDLVFERPPGSSPPPPAAARIMASKPNVVLVSTDGLTAGFGSRDARSATPHLDRFRAKAVDFENAFAAANATHTSISALHTGQYLSQLPLIDDGRVRRYPNRIAPETVMLAERFRDAGYRTVAIVDGSFLNPADWEGLFDGFGEVIDMPSRKPDRPRAGLQTDLATAEIERDSDAPLFMWVHYFDHHAPYEWGRPSGKEPEAAFRGALAATDVQWGRLFAAIESRWVPNERVAVFTADHGEAFDALHTEARHNHCLRTPELHVPLFFLGPWNPGTRKGLASLLDVAPTLLSVTGLKPLTITEGWDLSATLSGEPLPERVLLAVDYLPKHRLSRQDPFVELAVRTSEHHLIWNLETGNRVLTNWTADATDTTNRVDEASPELELLNWIAVRELARLRLTERGIGTRGN